MTEAQGVRRTTWPLIPWTYKQTDTFCNFVVPGSIPVLWNINWGNSSKVSSSGFPKRCGWEIHYNRQRCENGYLVPEVSSNVQISIRHSRKSPSDADSVISPKDQSSITILIFRYRWQFPWKIKADSNILLYREDLQKYSVSHSLPNPTFL